MFQCHGGILERCVHIRLGKMPCIACLSEKAEIRKAEGFDQARLMQEAAYIRLPFYRCMGEHKPQQHDMNADINKKEA